MSSNRLGKRRFGSRAKIFAALLCLTFGIVILALCNPATPSSPCAALDTDFTTGAGASYSPLLGTPEPVPISEGACWCEMWDTEQGWIKYDAPNIQEPIPICLDASDMENWTITAYSYGGYEPKDGQIKVYQWKEHVYGYWDLVWSYVGPCDDQCCCSEWVAHVDLNDPTSICLDSSIYPPCSNKAGDTIPGKKVSICLCQTWTGCGHINQDFTKMLVQLRSSSFELGKVLTQLNGLGESFFLL